MNGLSFFCSKQIPIILQSEATECGLACAAMVSAFHGKRLDLPYLRNQYSISLKGTTVKQLIRVTEELQLISRPIRVDLESLKDVKVPAILHWDFNHFVVLEKMDGESVSIIDPAIGRRRFSLGELGRHFTGIAIELSPGSEFKKEDVQQKLRLWPIFKSVKGLKKSVLYIFLLAVALQVFSMISPMFMQIVVDHAITSSDSNLLVVLAFGFLLLGLIQVLIGFIRSWMVLILGTSLDYELQRTLFSHLMKLPVLFFEKRHVGDILSRFESLKHIQKTLAHNFIESIVDGVLAVLTLILMYFYSGVLTAIVVASATFYALLRIIMYSPLHTANQDQIVWSAKQQSHFLESLRGVQSIKLSNAEADRNGQYNNLMTEQYNAGISVEKLGILYRSFNGFFASIENIAVITVGGFAILSGSLSIGMLFAFIAYKRQFITSISALIDRAIDLKMLSLHLGRVADIALEEKEPSGGIKVASGPEKVSVKNLSYRHSPSEPLLFKEINLEIKAGEAVAIVGPSGVGKSTLIKLLLGIVKPTEGDIFWGETSLSKIDLRCIRDVSSAVLQEAQLVAGSIKDNIIFSSHEENMDWLYNCAQMAAIDAEIKMMPMAYDTLIGDMGACLSSGQKQRILLARALYRRPSILFLDEATSHLDVDNERNINSVLAKLRITRIIVAHRPKTIASADRVLILSPNGIKEINDHSKEVDSDQISIECATA